MKTKTNKVNKTVNNKGVFIKKFQIPDLQSELARDFHLGTSWDCLTSVSHLCLDWEDDEGSSYFEGYSVNTVEYLEGKTELEKKEVAIRAANVIKTEGAFAAEMSPEVLDLYAQQILCVEQFPNGLRAKEVSTTVTLVLQRQSLAGRWYNFGDKLRLDFDDIFEEVSDRRYMVKMISESESVLDKLLALYEIKQTNYYSYVNNEGELVCVNQKQRVAMFSQSFKAGIFINNVRLEATVAPFSYSYNEKTKEVEKKPTFFTEQNMEDSAISFFAIAPHFADESNGDAADASFNDGIMYGETVVTQSMMTDDIQDQCIAFEVAQEKALEVIGKQAKRAVMNKKDIQVAKDEHFLATEKIGLFIKELAELSHQAKLDREAEIKLDQMLNSCEFAPEEILNAAQVLRRVTGNGLEYSTWRKVDKMHTARKTREFVKQANDAVDEYTKFIIGQINAGFKKVEELDDDTVVKVREASVQFGKKLPGFWIVNKEVSNYIKSRAAQAKGVAG